MSDDSERDVEADKKKTRELIQEIENSGYTNLDDVNKILKNTPEMLQFDEFGDIIIHSSVGRAFQLISKKTTCSDVSKVKEGLTGYYKKINKNVSLSTSKNMSNLCADEDTNMSGGSKLRRKPMRKTRRGRTRKTMSKSKSNTHRRRRHSRVRKHKKYTSRRR
jgi:uncharacterized protein YkvS